MPAKIYSYLLKTTYIKHNNQEIRTAEIKVVRRTKYIIYKKKKAFTHYTLKDQRNRLQRKIVEKQIYLSPVENVSNHNTEGSH